MPVGSVDFVRSHVESLSKREMLHTTAQHIAAMKDRQVALLILRMSLAQRTACAERNMDPAVRMPTWRRADSLLLWKPEELVEMPNHTIFDDFAPAGFSRALLASPVPLPRLNTDVSSVGRTGHYLG